MSLPEQEIYTTSNRRWLGQGIRRLDAESLTYLEHLAPEAEGRLVDGAGLGISHEMALQKARLETLSHNMPYAALIPIDVVTSKYIRELTKWSGLRCHIYVGCGRIKTNEYIKNRAATGSAVVLFYPHEGETTMSLED